MSINGKNIFLKNPSHLDFLVSYTHAYKVSKLGRNDNHFLVTLNHQVGPLGQSSSRPVGNSVDPENSCHSQLING